MLSRAPSFGAVLRRGGWLWREGGGGTKPYIHNKYRAVLIRDLYVLDPMRIR